MLQYKEGSSCEPKYDKKDMEEEYESMFIHDDAQRMTTPRE